MLRNWSGVGGGGEDNIPCTCTHVGCYATGQGWVGGMITFLALAHMLDPKTKTISRAFGHMIYSFAWRKSLGPRTGPQFLEELSRVW